MSGYVVYYTEKIVGATRMQSQGQPLAGFRPVGEGVEPSQSLVG